MFGIGSMKIYVGKPSEELRDFVSQYWSLESDRETDFSDQLIYPTANTEIMLHYGEPFLGRVGVSHQVPQPEELFCGQKSASAFVAAREVVGVFVITFTPAGAAVFLPSDHSQYRNTFVPLGDLLGSASGALREQIGNALGFDDRIAIAERFMKSNLNSRKAEQLNSLFHATRYAAEHCLTATVEQMADEACVSFRTLDRLFSANIGLSPKEFLKIERLKFAIGLMRTRSGRSLTDVAIESGYYDQPHFNNDFRKVIGVTPSGFRSMIAADPVCTSELRET